MQLHRDHDCPRKHAAFTTLVAAGRITPDSTRSRSIHRLRNDSPPMEHDDSDRFDALARRAAQLGYTLTQNWPNSHYWHLLDPLDNKPLHTAATLDDIETWLAT